MNVQSILTEKGGAVISVTPEASVADAARVLAENRIGSVLVIDTDGKLSGILSERDIVRGIGQQGPDCLSHAVASLMTRDVITCSREATIQDLMGHMTRGRFRHMPVVEAGTVVGVVSIGDVVKQRIAEAEMETAAMRAYIATG